MKGVYNARKHPKFLSGEQTEDQVFESFLEKFEINGNLDGVVSTLILNLLRKFEFIFKFKLR